ncbi:OLC1v1021063C1 [Oldenlandia corymbosa var. corymbosa]|uniref:OLC1v1021063C1 n=1 Tax=Oldenlandia corymbosa var. corymbosa TaxID=529605 RepID=A0AAV1BWB9_OLDCO|nr:OLC1v1021063C1 [Oldenlandia corymbosa var. corymbosa]
MVFDSLAVFGYKKFWNGNAHKISFTPLSSTFQFKFFFLLLVRCSRSSRIAKSKSEEEIDQFFSAQNRLGLVVNIVLIGKSRIRSRRPRSILGGGLSEEDGEGGDVC